MKELSIKEKAERYDELLEKLRKAKVDNDVCDERYCCVIDDIVPELKESEDERIRKMLIEFFGKGAEYNGSTNGISDKEVLAWLEKQGEQNLPLKEIILNVWELGNYWKDLTKGVCNTEHGTQLDYILKHWTEGEHYTKLLEKQGEQKHLEGENKESYDTCDSSMMDNKKSPYSEKRDFGYFEKQGETKPFDYENTNIQQNDFAPKSAMEAINEEKVDNANKVEPKFKVRDWVMLDRPVLITKVEATPYNTHRYWTSDGTWFGDATKAHLWTIADANAGDVLATDGYIILFKKLLPHDGGVSYCHYDYACTNPHFDFNEDDNWLFNEKSGIIHPATKEQHDLLFAKMREAGYEWDTEKKELKKIDSKSIFDVEIPFGAKDSELEEVFYSIPKGFHAEIEDDKVVIKKGEKKPARSDEHYELEEFAKIVRCNLTGISKAVQKLFEAKYLQLTGNKMYGGLKD